MGNLFYSVFNNVIKQFGVLLTVIHDALPKSPFKIQIDWIQKYLGWLNYLLPISEMVIILEAWCSCILIYYVYQIILRWVKAIE